MSDFDFSKLTNRLNTNSLKFNVLDNELPMWVADMDFESAPEVVKTIVDCAKSGLYGYKIVNDEFYQSIIDWWKKRHNLELKKEYICFVYGVVPAICSIIKAFSKKNDFILVQSPVYGTFYKCIKANNRKVLENPLIYKNNAYKIDFKDLEKKLKHSKTKIMILCNPHNPIGKIWQRQDLEKIATLCKKYKVLVISDEIHCDITQDSYTPFASIDNHNSITLISPSKAFNLASIHSASAFAANPHLKRKIYIAFNADKIADIGAFSVEASICAYKQEEWLNALNEVIAKNKNYAKIYIKMHTPLKVVPSNATYLLWVDCSAICKDTTNFATFLREKTGLFISKGIDFGKNGKSFIRINIATQKERLQDGLKRLVRGVELYCNENNINIKELN
ncbi:pyridoxal phosphate-dependent aminotransferase [Campylobacter sp. LR291e]|uniref:MalY/PatB family protein n=1 Tax=Campylobacter sp. LR291e TaxID=2593546 RepID=UPI001238DDA4|nr:MalY/PatB family protein [Campylobacter sp. LR291e]KAA6230244.1 pyridoxal phosphate-dependent aminotransferase [Campylobacter sp. LR291e]